MNPNAVGKKEFGIMTAMIVLVQSLSTAHTSNISYNQYESLKEQINEISLEQEKFFLRKTDVSTLFEKLDRVEVNLQKVREDIATLKADYGSDISCQDAHMGGSLAYGR